MGPATARHNSSNLRAYQAGPACPPILPRIPGGRGRALAGAPANRAWRPPGLVARSQTDRGACSGARASWLAGAQREPRGFGAFPGAARIARSPPTAAVIAGSVCTIVRSGRESTASAGSCTSVSLWRSIPEARLPSPFPTVNRPAKATRTANTPKPNNGARTVWGRCPGRFPELSRAALRGRISRSSRSSKEGVTGRRCRRHRRRRGHPTSPSGSIRIG